MKSFLTHQQIASLVKAIQSAEEHSTGEIRVHIDSNTETRDAETAFEVFKRLCMNNTADRNAVLFHVNFERKYLTIIGDIGIHEKVRQSYWDQLHDYITGEFAKGNYYKALESAILKTGLELKKHFPVTGENPNQLSNEITFS
ncbi:MULTISPECIES: TPM domain-containing protein [Chryseobacterium]|uniref:Membrane protein n=1 Tax=Chryseobacterium camelliae TaxID=1265445 RepID=A0ABU0TCT7_9FLAO|nr:MULTISPECIES: TPM domain-containing protein [Chryseobacterium]MDQ1094887.1 putative membrane protein [Chryseobacterium camelliae]MDQ1098825.1 putative membrane protein [Chryseobacterium sp. SORGH_AS_1048]MDR6086176.1 putative membrane protein [Chryseobacterium sp. SORGH_AS_0909]MDT3407324.1 putative membrane protein [Pseudacidovorax intermedius]